MVEGKAKRPKITFRAMMEECDNILDVEEVYKSIYRENKYSVHSNVNENNT